MITRARLKFVSVRTNVLEPARAVVASCVRKSRQSRISSCANVSLHRVNADRMHSNKHLTGTWSRCRHLFQPKNVRLPKFMHQNRLHRFLLLAFYPGSNLPTGGWTYSLPLLSKPKQRKAARALTRPGGSSNLTFYLFFGAPGGRALPNRHLAHPKCIERRLVDCRCLGESVVGLVGAERLAG